MLEVGETGGRGGLAIEAAVAKPFVSDSIEPYFDKPRSPTRRPQPSHFILRMAPQLPAAMNVASCHNRCLWQVAQGGDLPIVHDLSFIARATLVAGNVLVLVCGKHGDGASQQLVLAEQTGVFERLHVGQVAQGVEAVVRQKTLRRDVAVGRAGLRAAGTGGDESERPQVADGVAADLFAEQLPEFAARDRLEVGDASG